MRPGHLERLAALCPVCLRQGERASPVELATVIAEEAGQVVEGILVCGHEECRSEFPILDGMPLLLPELRRYVAATIDRITGRGDLSPELESLLGDCCGPDSPFETSRRLVSSYAWDHWADQDRERRADGDESATGEPHSGDTDPGDPNPGSAARLLDAALELAGELPDGPVLDLGCATGRTTFELARRVPGVVLGLDLHYALLRVAADALRRGAVAYPYRRVGMVYDRRQHPVDTAGAERVDFWLADAAALPFPPGGFAAIVGLNLVDSVASPTDTLLAASRCLAEDGRLLLATPWDWSPGATPVEAWVGGHSQRGPDRGAAEPALRRLLAHAGLEVVAERQRVPWRVRLHDRCSVDYRTHLVVARKASTPS